MITARADSNNGNYDRHFVVTCIDEETSNQAQAIFDDYKNKGVILNDSFNDNFWLLTNQVARTSLCFKIDQLMYLRTAQRWIGCSCLRFVNCIKIYTLLQIGSLSLSSLQCLVNSLTEFAEISAYEQIPINVHTLEFLKMLPDSTEMRAFAIENMEDQTLFSQQMKGLKLQRILASFENYFKFNDYLEQFWINAAGEERLFYFPLFLWWKLTVILPLRPTEFLLIPRRCLSRENGESILTVRRTRLKGGGKPIRYNIADDYRLMKYCIPETLAAEIEAYIEAISQMPLPEIDTLFALGYRGGKAKAKFYSYLSLRSCLKRFQKEKMGIDLSSDECIHLGDTRHLAMISLIISGGSPTICKELAGHEDINISSHYYANISRFIECATYEFSRKQKAHHVEMREHRIMKSAATVAVTGGRCDSEVYAGGSIGDCLRHMGSSGELGECASCRHFIDGKTGRYLAFLNADEKRKQVDEDCKYLMHMLETVRKGAGCDDDIQSALLRLQGSSARYSQCLYRNMEEL